jgi:hypothetical protein
MGIFDEMAAEIDKLRAENEELREERDREQRYMRELAANSHLSAAQKWAMWAIRERLGRVAREGEQLTEVKVYEVAKDIGMSKERTGELIQSLASTGAIARREHYVTDEGGKHRTRILVGLTLFSGRPKEIASLIKRNHGGKRERCEHCGGENLEVYEAYICKDCGHIHQAHLKRETKGRRGFIPE